jgi:heme-degrading monooxygenase HmoA
MTFAEGNEQQFLQLFNSYREHIAGAPGCLHLELWRDLDDPTVFFTYSHWDHVDSLNGYRDSELFKEVWPKTKVLFGDKPQAWTIQMQLEK